MKRRNFSLPAARFALVALIIVLPGLLPAQDAKSLLFQEVETALSQAKSAGADVYSPNQFESGLKYYNEASTDYEKGKSLEAIRKKLNMSSVYFLKSVETTKLATLHLSSCINARTDALEAEAPQYREDNWRKAEDIFRNGLKALEQGFLDDAKSRAAKAEELYRQVELESIKANYLDEATDLIKQANRKNIKRRAPQTLAKAIELAERAEKMLEENKYDTDQARQLAQEAKYEATHAIFLGEAVQALEKEDKTVEDVFLAFESKLQEISDEFDLNAKFHEGAGKPVADIITNIQQLFKDKMALEQDLSDKTAQLAGLNEDFQKIRSQLGNLQNEKADLNKIMEEQRLAIERQKAAKEKFERVQNMFTADEAKVLREENNVVIQVYGLTFPVGKAIIESEYYGLLSKVLKAVDEYPDASLFIKGHTDSWGSDATNQELSTERAGAVRDYMMATAGIDSTRIQAVGFGESRPIASNETKEGRRKNRRIEIVIEQK